MNRGDAVGPVQPACGADADDRCALCGDVAIPGRVVEVHFATRSAEVDLGGMTSMVALDLLEDVTAGDWVLVHQGFAIGRVEPT